MNTFASTDHKKQSEAKEISQFLSGFDVKIFELERSFLFLSEKNQG